MRGLRLAQVGPRIEGLLEGTDGQVQLGEVCVQRGDAPVAVIAMQPTPASTSPPARMAATVSWPGK
jgi:hypothetical protein